MDASRSTKASRLIMGMPVGIEVIGAEVAASRAMELAFAYLRDIDQRFSPRKETSELRKLNRGELAESEWSPELKEIMRLGVQTKEETDGYFDLLVPEALQARFGKYDTSGLVKGWAIRNAANIIAREGFNNFYIEAGGDIEARGVSILGTPWKVGIQDPFDEQADKVAGASPLRRIVKTVGLSGKGIATSGTYIRGQHIYNPRDPQKPLDEIVSISVIGPDVYEADRFATAAFAMGKAGIAFIESLRPRGFEGYSIDRDGIATMTSGFEAFVLQ